MKRYEGESLAYYAYVQDGDKKWISNIRFNGLFVIDDNTNQVKFVGRFPCYREDEFAIHSLAAQCNNKLYFFPQRGKSIDIYDLNTHKFYSESIEPWSDMPIGIVAGIIQEQEKFWIFPRHAGGDVLLYSTESSKFIDSYKLEKATKIVENSPKKVLSFTICKVENEVCLPLYGTNTICFTNLKEKKERIVELEDVSELQFMSYDGNYAWLAENDNVIKWDINNDTLKRFDHVLSSANTLLHKTEISDLVCKDGGVWIIPRWYDKIVFIDSGDIVHEISLDDVKAGEVDDIIKSWKTFGRAILHKHELVIPPVALNREIIIDFEHKKVSGRLLEAEEQSVAKSTIKMDRSNQELRSDDLINLISSLSKNEDKGSIERGDYGRAIFSECIK